MFGSFEESNDAGGAETAGVTTIQSAVNKAQLSETRRTSTPQSRGCNSVGAQVSARYPIIRCRTANSSSCAATNGLAFRPVRASAAIGDWSPFRASAAWRSSITVGARRLARGLADELRGGEEPVELREIAAEVVQLRALEPGAVELAGPDRPHGHAVALDLVASDEAGLEAEPLPVRDRHRPQVVPFRDRRLKVTRDRRLEQLLDLDRVHRRAEHGGLLRRWLPRPLRRGEQRLPVAHAGEEDERVEYRPLQRPDL